MFYNNLFGINSLTKEKLINTIESKNNNKDKIDSFLQEILIDAIDNKNENKIDLIFEVVKEKRIFLNIFKTNENGDYPFLRAFFTGNEKIVNKLIEYIEYIKENKNEYKNINIKLAINEHNNYGNYPFLSAVDNNKIEIAELLIKFANDNKIILDINKKNFKGNYPLLWAIFVNNVEMVKLIIEYANKNEIVLNINEIDIKNLIHPFVRLLFYNYKPISSISEINNEIIKLLYNYSLEKIIKFTFLENSEILLIFKKIIDDTLTDFIKNNNKEMINKIINYSKNNNINLDNLLNKSKNEIDISLSVENSKFYEINKSGNLTCYQEVYSIENEERKDDEIKTLNEKDNNFNNGESCLMKKIKKYDLENSGKINKIKKIINEKVDINFTNKYGDTPLICACYKFEKNIDIIKYLVEKGANITMENSVGISPLNILIRSKDNTKTKDIINYFIENGTDINYKGKNDISPLFMACYFSNSEMVCYLIEKNVNINEKNNDGDTALMIACYFNNLEIIKLLIKNNAKLDITNKHGDTPFTIINSIGNLEIKNYFNSIKEEIIKLLIENNAKLDITNKHGDTPFTIVNSIGNLEIKNYFNSIKEEIIKLLIENNAKLDITNKHGDTPFTIVNSIGNLEIKNYFNSIKEEIIKLLIENNAKLDITNKHGDTPFTIVNSIGNLEIKNYFNSIKEEKHNETNNSEDIESSNRKEIQIEKKECYISNSKIVSKDILINILELQEKSIGLITVGKKKMGTCFLVKFHLPLKKNLMYGFITNNHVLNSDDIKNGNYEIQINRKKVNIKANEKDLKFTCQFIDTTFIQITDSKFIKDKEYNFIEQYIENNDTIEVIIIQYPVKNRKNKICFSSGDIDHESGFNIYHKASTGEGSSGSPLLNNEMKVIGLHRSAVKKKINLATNFNTIYYAISILYSKRYIYPIESAREFPRELSEEENNELKKHGLMETSIPYLYRCQYYCNSSSIILFYRTNHAWYWTITPSNKEYILEEIPLYEWKLFNFYKSIEENLGKMNDNLKHYHKVIFMWLKLSELMYI